MGEGGEEEVKGGAGVIANQSFPLRLDRNSFYMSDEEEVPLYYNEATIIV